MESVKKEKSFKFPVSASCKFCINLSVCLAQSCYLSCCIWQEVMEAKERRKKNA